MRVHRSNTPSLPPSPNQPTSHWDELRRLLGPATPIPPVADLTVGHLLAAGVLARVAEVDDLAVRAVKEAAVEAKLAAIAAEWTAASLIFTKYKNRGDVVLKVGGEGGGGGGAALRTFFWQLTLPLNPPSLPAGRDCRAGRAA